MTLGNVLAPPVRSSPSKEEEYWRDVVVQENSSWPVMLNYTPLTAFYQDTFLACNVNTTEAIAGCWRNISCWNGKIGWDVEHYYGYYSNFITRYSLPPMEYNFTFKLKPDELDRNFNMTVHIEIGNDTGVSYCENHTFWVVGTPEIIPGRNIFDDVDIWEIFWVSLIIEGPIAGVITVIHVRRRHSNLQNRRMQV